MSDHEVWVFNQGTLLPLGTGFQSAGPGTLVPKGVHMIK